MNFNTIAFLVFLAPAVAVYYLARPRLKNAVLLLASLFFYLMGSTPGFVVFLLLSAALSWLCSQRLAGGGRGWLYLTVGAQLGLLAFFKYNAFFAPQLAGWLGQHGLAYTVQSGGAWRILMPLGISYYTFQMLGYVLDVWRGRCPAEKSFFHYLLFASFFPQLTAGPIASAGDLLPQLHQNHRFNYDTVTEGGRLMLLGYFKKIAVADMLALYLDPIFDQPGAYTGLTLFSAVVLYAMYLYCDFSGYSDIARGCAGLFGIRLQENFNTPYLACGFSELWRRWHISLSNWLKLHVYIDLLGGNRKGKVRKYCNLFLTFAISGLWHGVGFNYLVWGSLQGVFQVAEHFLTNHGKLQADPHGWARAARVAAVFLLNAATLTVFRLGSLHDSWYVLTHQFLGISPRDFAAQATAVIGSGFNATPLLIAAYIAFCALGLAIVIWSDCYRCFVLQGGCLAVRLGQQRTWVRWLIYYLLLALILAAFLMRNGNYVGSVSFAYGGF